MLNVSTPWHRESFDRFLHERLPQLLAARLPLTGYQADATSRNACRVTVSIAGPSGEVQVTYTDIPQPDENGVFAVHEQKVVVYPTASQDELDLAVIACVGEQLYDFVAARLGDAPTDLPWDEALVRAWLPLDSWVREFLANIGQEMPSVNWLDRYTQFRRLFVPHRKRAITSGHFGRTCPIETPEGPNVGKYLVIAMGATIQDGRLVILDDRPEASLGLCASMIPFLEHNDPTRLLMGTNMMRQWMRPPDPEPALVQSGSEPDAPDFWCGRNLLTAFVSWGADTFEDAVVISESCAKRLNYPTPVEPGDKLSNRYGAKGVVSSILPDDAMPHLEDGTPVELVYSFTGLISRLNFGQVREALMSRIARAEGAPAVVPPFHAPDEAELHARLAAAGLPEDGMTQLTLGRSGKPLERRSMVGWVYWGRLFHLARKMRANVTPPGDQDRHIWASNEFHQRLFMDGAFSQQMGEREYVILRDEHAFEAIREQFNTRSEARPDADTLAARVAAGPVAQAGPSSPQFAELTRRLAVAGIRTELADGQGSPQGTQGDTEEGKEIQSTFEGERLRFRFAEPEGATLTLARPLPHPWLQDRLLMRIGAFPEAVEYAALVEANARLERMVVNQAPESLLAKARAELENRAQAFFAALLPPSCVQFESRVLFGGRAVIAPGADLDLDQVSLPEEIAWTLFGPLVSRELGKAEEIQKRSKAASQALDAVMARSHILLHRAPTLSPTAFIALRPVRDPSRVVRLHPCINPLMDADYDGDQIAVFLPITEAGQREAAERLSPAAHLERDPTLLRRMTAWHAGRFGLAGLSLRPEGRKEIGTILGLPVATPEGFVTGDSLLASLQTLLARDGEEKLFAVLNRLQRRGFEAAKESGASMNPFIGKTVRRPPTPPTEDPDAWTRYAEEIQEQMAARTDYADDDIGVQLLSIKSGARGSLRQLAWFAGIPNVMRDIHSNPAVIRHNLCEGVTPPEFFAMAVGAREGQHRIMQEYEQIACGAPAGSGPRGFSVLARAMRAAHPGIVFARAAANGEVDPLNETDTRLFVGLPAQVPEQQ